MIGPATLAALLLSLLSATSGSHVMHAILPEAAANPQAANLITGWARQQTAQCSKWFETRRHMTAEEQQRVSQELSRQGSQNTSSTSDAGWCPALLWTYTGSANTMTRMLIEAASGWYTGSVYTGR